MSALRDLSLVLGIALAAACTSPTSSTINQRIECNDAAGELECHATDGGDGGESKCADIDTDGDGHPGDVDGKDVDGDGALNHEDHDDDGDGVKDDLDTDDDNDGIEDDLDCDCLDGGDHESDSKPLPEQQPPEEKPHEEPPPEEKPPGDGV